VPDLSRNALGPVEGLPHVLAQLAHLRGKGLQWLDLSGNPALLAANASAGGVAPRAALEAAAGLTCTAELRCCRMLEPAAPAPAPGAAGAGGGGNSSSSAGSNLSSSSPAPTPGATVLGFSAFGSGGVVVTAPLTAYNADTRQEVEYAAVHLANCTLQYH
jgi:hypothetical protein